MACLIFLNNSKYRYIQYYLVASFRASCQIKNQNFFNVFWENQSLNTVTGKCQCKNFSPYYYFLQTARKTKLSSIQNNQSSKFQKITFQKLMISFVHVKRIVTEFFPYFLTVLSSYSNRNIWKYLYHPFKM